MSKRNLILLIIVLVVIIAFVFGFLYFSSGAGPTGNNNNGGTNFIARFNPFGNSVKPAPPKVTPPANVSGFQPNPTVEAPKTKLTKVSSMPVAGFTVFIKERLKNVPVIPPTTTTTDATTPDATTAPTPAKNTKIAKPTPPLTEFMPALRYVDRATGNIYQTFADKIEERKFTVTIIPKIYEAFFGIKGESVAMRYLKPDNRTIETFVGNLPKEYLGADTTASNEVKGSFLPENVKDTSLSSDASSAFYLFNSGDNMIGTTINLSTGKKVQLFSSPFTEWLSQWPNSKMITLTTKPASGIPGYMFALDPNTKNLSQVLGNISGLTTNTSPNGKLVLYSDSNLSLYNYQIDTKVSNQLGVRTLPEKCVWGKLSDFAYCAVPKSLNAAPYPDSWYQGETSFSDQIWKIDTKTGNATMIYDPSADPKAEAVDGIKLALDDGENYLFFVNKKDSYLWELALK